jgi:ubiquinone/menaquinone biosynthesis C-methylase UbiE
VVERLIDAVELLDGPLDDPAALAGNLRDLARINRWLGGASLSASAIDTLADGHAELRVLDVGTGGADIPMALLENARTTGRRLTIVAVDDRTEVLDAAVLARPAVATTPGLELRLSDGRGLPDPDASVDIAHTSLVLHHLTPSDAVTMLRELARVARLGIVVNDVTRSRLGWIGAWLLGHLLTRNRFTRHDAPLSVRRAYTAAEMTALLREAGLEPVRVVRGVVGQRYAIAARRPGDPRDPRDGEGIAP